MLNKKGADKENTQVNISNISNKSESNNTLEQSNKDFNSTIKPPFRNSAEYPNNYEIMNNLNNSNPTNNTTKTEKSKILINLILR